MLGSLMQMLNDPEAMQQFAELLPKLQALIEQVDRIEKKVDTIWGYLDQQPTDVETSDGPTS